MPYQQLEEPIDGDWRMVRRNFASLRKDMNPPVPQARVYNNANISIANNTVTSLTFNSEGFDNGDLHSTSANTGRLTAPITGLYIAGYTVQWASNATGYRFSGLRLNGATRVGGDDTRPPVTGAVTLVTGVTLLHMTASDYLEVLVYQNSGGALNIDYTADNTPFFWMARLGGFVNQGV